MFPDRMGMARRVEAGAECCPGQRVGDPDGRILLVFINIYDPPRLPQLSAGPGPASQSWSDGNCAAC